MERERCCLCSRARGPELRSLPLAPLGSTLGHICSSSVHLQRTDAPISGQEVSWRAALPGLTLLFWSYPTQHRDRSPPAGDKATCSPKAWRPYQKAPWWRKGHPQWQSRHFQKLRCVLLVPLEKDLPSPDKGDVQWGSILPCPVLSPLLQRTCLGLTSPFLSP